MCAQPHIKAFINHHSDCFRERESICVWSLPCQYSVHSIIKAETCLYGGHLSDSCWLHVPQYMNLLTHRSQCNYGPRATHHDSLTNYSKSNGPRVVIVNGPRIIIASFLSHCRNILLLDYHRCSASILSLQLIIVHI